MNPNTAFFGFHPDTNERIMYKCLPFYMNVSNSEHSQYDYGMSISLSFILTFSLSFFLSLLLSDNKSPSLVHRSS